MFPGPTSVPLHKLWFDVFKSFLNHFPANGGRSIKHYVYEPQQRAHTDTHIHTSCVVNDQIKTESSMETTKCGVTFERADSDW